MGGRGGGNKQDRGPVSSSEGRVILRRGFAGFAQGVCTKFEERSKKFLRISRIFIRAHIIFEETLRGENLRLKKRLARFFSFFFLPPLLYSVSCNFPHFADS